jgi:hypothetical protein
MDWDDCFDELEASINYFTQDHCLDKKNQQRPCKSGKRLALL